MTNRSLCCFLLVTLSSYSSGNPESEAYRLSTFIDFPRHVPVDPTQFAFHGFYYTGYKDRVKCFSCGQCHENWMVGDDISLARWHREDCQFISGTDRTDIPIDPTRPLVRAYPSSPTTPQQDQACSSSLATTSATREQTFWDNANILSQSNVSNVDQGASIQCSDDVTQSNSQGGIGQEVTGNQHSGTFFQTPPQVRTQPNNLPPRQLQDHTGSNSQTSTSATRENGSQLRENDSHPSSLSSCLHPVNPHMRSTEARLQTFKDNENIWPAHRIRITPQEIADAGFFYLGEKDRTKCWYCNVGLHNWERHNNPWEEHAKWFPMCEYVLQHAENIHGIDLRFPNLRRQVSLSNRTLGMSSHTASRLLQERHPASLNLPSTSNSPVVIDPREELRRREKKIEEEMSSSELVANARMLGFEDRIIKESLKRQYEQHNDMFPNFESFVDAMQSISDLPDAAVDELSSPSGEGHSLSNGNPSTSDDFLEMQRLQEDRICKVCRREIACMVFIPCGHLACCLECGRQAAKCPFCKIVIEENIRCYFS